MELSSYVASRFAFAKHGDESPTVQCTLYWAPLMLMKLPSLFKTILLCNDLAIML